MPSRLLLPIFAVALLSMPSISEAQETLHDMVHGVCVPDCIRKWYCDDYCPKPIPCPAYVKCFGCDCYHAKQVPCPRDVKCFRCDDYCRKPFPSICCPPIHSVNISPGRQMPLTGSEMVPEVSENVSDANSEIEIAETELIDLTEPNVSPRQF